MLLSFSIMKYKINPIKEAIFDLRIDKLKEPSIINLENIHSFILNKYPKKIKQISYSKKIGVYLNKKIREETNQEVRGFLFSNKEDNRKVQIQLDGFTFNMLSPYSEWEQFSKEALRLWKIYKKNLEPSNIIRIALRYINRIDIPLKNLQFQDYITNIPSIPKGLPQTFRNFFTQIEVPLKDERNVIITETIDKPEKEKLPFILDIDVYKNRMIEKKIGTIHSEFEILREIKNITFEDCITEKTRRLFK